MIKLDGLEITYNGSNGWYYRAEGQSLTGACCPNNRFGDGESIIDMSGRVLATPGRAAIAAEIAEFEAGRQARIAAASPATRTMRRYAVSGNGGVSATEFDNLRESLGDDIAAQMARQMQG